MNTPSLALRALRFSVFTLLLTPLVNFDRLDFSYNTTKAFFFMGAVEVLLVGFLWLLVKEPEWRPRWNAVSIAFTSFFIVLVLATVLSVDPFVSFWGTAERTDGLLMWLHMGAAFFMFASLFRSQKDWNEVFSATCAVGLIVSALFFVHRINPAVLADSRGGSTFGNSTYLGAYLLFSLFFALVLARTSASSRVLRVFGWVSACVFSLTILMTSALAAKGALAIWVVLFGAFVLIAAKSRLLRRAGWVVLSLLAILFLVSGFSLFRADGFVRARFIELSSGARFAAWGVAWEAFLDRPLLGWGPENFSTAFFAHYNPCFGASPCGGEIWFDRAHSVPLDLLASGGVLLLAAYLALWLAAVRRVFRTRDTGLLFLAFLFAYQIHNLVQFEIFATYSSLILVFAYAAASTEAPSQVPPLRRRAPRIALAVLCTLLLPLGLTHTLVRSWSDSQMIRVMEASAMEDRSEPYRQMMDGSPIGRDFRRVVLAGQTVEAYYGFDETARESIKEPLREEIRVGIAALTQTVHRSPNNLRALSMLGLLYQIQSQDNDPSALAKAEEVLRVSLTLNPVNQQAYWPLAAVFVQKGDTARAYDLLDRAIAFSPSHPDSALKKLVAVKLSESHEAFLEETQKILAEHPEFEPRLRVLTDLGESRPDWLYKLFY